MSGRRYALWGSSGHAKVLADLFAQTGDELAILFDNSPNASPIAAGIPLYIGEAGFAQWVNTVVATEYHGLVAIGGARGKDRLAIQALFRRHGIRIEAAIHPRAYVAQSAQVGAGTQVLAHALIAADAAVGEACIINHGASIDHECMIGDGVHLAPGATLCGCVEVGANVMIGAGACVLPRIRIGTGSIIGAGSLVTSDIAPGMVAYGHPAKAVRPIAG